MTGLEALSARLRPVPAGRCLLGISGGADSVALLLILLPLHREGVIRLEAMHVNHGLRGEASQGDEAFVRALCGEKGVRLHVAALDLGGRRDENTAREARYEAFRGVMTREGIPTLILAHHRDDQAETFLMRLLRGAGPEGLGAMSPREVRAGYTLLRPLLEVSGQELEEALREAGQPWREDESNRDAAYLRNRVRGELLPLMEACVPGAAGRIARTAGMISEENEAMDRAAEALLTAAEAPEGLEIAPLLEAPPALRKRVLRRWWRLRGPVLSERELNYEQTGRLCGLLEAPRGTIINLPAGWRARREKGRLRLLPPGDRTKNNRPRGGKGKTHD